MASSAQWLTFTKPFCGIALKFNGDMFPEYMGLFEDYATGVFTEAAYEEK